MDPVAPPAPARPHPLRWIAAVIALALIPVLFGRWLSTNLTIGTEVTDRWCEQSTGFCVEHVERRDWLILTPVDEFHLVHRGQPRYYTADNPFGADPALTVDFTDAGVSLTDGTATLTWPAATLARLGD